MAIFCLNEDEFKKIDITTFNDEGILERRHLQSALKGHIDIIAPDSIVISEEFSDGQIVSAELIYLRSIKMRIS